MDTAKVVSELQKGSHKAFEVLFREYYILLCYEARSYLSEKYLIEELVDDVFRWLWENRENLIITTSVRAYLIKAIHNACLSYLRQNIPEQVELEDSTTMNTLFAVGESPLDYVLSKELMERINQAVNDLPTQYKRVFELSRYQNLSYNEISTEMGISVNTVKLYQKKALARLRQELKDYAPALVD